MRSDPGTDDGPVTMNDIAASANRTLDQLFPAESGVRIIAEPGRYFVEASHTLCVEVIAKQDLRQSAVPRSPGLSSILSQSDARSFIAKEMQRKVVCGPCRAVCAVLCCA